MDEPRSSYGWIAISCICARADKRPAIGADRPRATRHVPCVSPPHMPISCFGAAEALWLVTDGTRETSDESRAARMRAHMADCGPCRMAVAEALATSDIAMAPTLANGDTDHPSIPTSGRIANRYQLVERLGAGACGVVFAGHDMTLDVPVAIKILRSDFDGFFQAMARRELLASRRIVHPNVCRLFDIGKDNGRPFVTMELVAGSTLEALLAQGPLGVDASLHIIEQLCAGIDAAHRAGVVHRDLKPANVMVEPAGRAVVMDFGLALDLQTSRRSLTGVVGTPAYWAPEQARGETVTARSDQFSLAVVAAEMLTGANDSSSGRPVSRAVQIVLQRAMSPDPAARFDAVADFGIALGLACARGSVGRFRATSVAAVSVACIAAVAFGASARASSSESRIPIGGSRTSESTAALAAAPSIPPPAQAPSAPATVTSAVPASPAGLPVARVAARPGRSTPAKQPPPATSNVPVATKEASDEVTSLLFRR
jgi:serine/threonine protein kinase